MYKKDTIFITAAIILGVTAIVGFMIQNNTADKAVTNTTLETQASDSTAAQEENLLKTYSNTSMGFSISYPATWVSHENPYAIPPGATTGLPNKAATWIFLAPEKLDINCNVAAPIIPTRYVHIISEEGNLAENRKRLNAKTGGQNLQESTLDLAGQKVFIYTNAYPAPCANDAELAFAIILISNGNKVFSIATDMYSSPAVKDAIASLKLLETKSATQDKTYKDTKAEFGFTYPDKLTLTKEGNAVVLSHSISYKNNGPCDMTGDTKVYSTLVDFKVRLELVSGTQTLPYTDGNYSAGALTGTWAYEGAEGCGYSTYHFPLSKNRTLIVTRDSIQPLSGVVAAEVQNEILKIPGVISKQESDALFETILASFTVIK